jgi:phage gp46-like protein
MTDASFICTPDGGDIVVENGTIGLNSGLVAAVYLSWFGGNEEDSGLDDGERKQYWANTCEPDPTRQYRSELQYLLRSMPLTPANLERAQDTAERDVAWMLETGLATEISVVASIPALNTIKLDGSITVNGEKVPFAFVEKVP